MPRYLLQGEWKRKIVHREIVDAARMRAVRDLKCIVYTDGTELHIAVRELRPRERVEEKRQYCELIRDAAKLGTPRVHVADLLREP